MRKTMQTLAGQETNQCQDTAARTREHSRRRMLARFFSVRTNAATGLLWWWRWQLADPQGSCGDHITLVQVAAAGKFFNVLRCARVLCGSGGCYGDYAGSSAMSEARVTVTCHEGNGANQHRPRTGLVTAVRAVRTVRLGEKRRKIRCNAGGQE